MVFPTRTSTLLVHDLGDPNFLCTNQLVMLSTWVKMHYDSFGTSKVLVSRMHLCHHVHPFRALFQKSSSVSNSCIFVKVTQPIKWVCRFELPRTPIWPNLVFFKWHPILFEWIINQPKVVLNKQCVMLTIITDIKMVLLNDIMWLKSIILTINYFLSMIVQYMY